MRKSIGIFEGFEETMSKMSSEGTLLVTGDPPNPMTIGWATIGWVWGKPIMTVYVRPTRYTFGLIEKSTDFTVSVLPDEFHNEISLCGTKSGRDINKIRECGFILEQSAYVTAPFIAQSDMHYECRIIHTNKIDPYTLDPAIINRYYPLRDFHSVYYGEILGVFKK